MPPHALAALDQSEQILDAQGQLHHAVSLGFGDIAHGVELQILLRGFDIFEADILRRGNLRKTFKIGDFHIHRGKLPGNPH